MTGTPRGIPIPGLAAIRRQVGLSQEQLASKARVSRKTICQLEQGANARYDTLNNLAIALRIPRELLIGTSGEIIHAYELEERKCKVLRQRYAHLKL